VTPNLKNLVWPMKLSPEQRFSVELGKGVAAAPVAEEQDGNTRPAEALAKTPAPFFPDQALT
jgi:hypothetical protein